MQSKGREKSRRAPIPRRVFLIEDNLDSVHTLAYVLRERGHVVDYAINGYAALDFAPGFGPDVVLLDLGLPDMDGLMVCRKLKRMRGFEKTRFIALTGESSDEARVRSLAAGCVAHLLKPANAPAIYELIEAE